jgi:hypothetical protein
MATPNVYHLHGPSLSVVYSTGDGGSLKALQYQDHTQSHNFSADQIRSVDTEIGTLVTVTIRMTVDAGSTSFTLLVPTVNLAGPNSPAHIKTEGITTIHSFSLVPNLNRGQTEIYTVTPLSGTAEFIPF